MITASRLTLRRGARALLQDVSFTIHAGWRVGVVGRNGTGKSTLFAAILGELAADRGDIGVLKGTAIATVAQETPALPDAALDYALDGDAELRELERRLQAAEAAHDAARIGAIHERLHAIGGYAARARAARLLHGLGFAPEEQERPVSSFSGGWRMRLNLAKALMCRSDLLLLDEPTNHLDLDAVIWLQDWLTSYPGTLLVISHDREFLDAVTTHTLHLEAQSATLYTGNYSQFERQRAERLTLQAAAYTRQQKQIAHLQSFINRFKAKASKATQAQSRVKQLERMQLVANVHADSEFSFEFPTPERLPSPLLRFDGVAAGYPGKTVLQGLKLLVAPGERIGLLGPNGAGKSTLVRTLAGELAPLSGQVMRDPYLRVGYFAQHQLEQLDPKASPILHLRRIDPAAGEQALRDFLGGFNFRGDRAFEAVAPFSGGEKARLALAMVVYRKPNLLLLDEPTNHLDLDMRHALETALLDYAGAVVIVSHDRHLLTAACDELWLVAEGRCRKFEGDLGDYARWLAAREAGEARDARSAAPPAAGQGDSRLSAKDQRRASADQRAALRPLKDAVRKLEAEMARLHEALKGFEAQLAGEEIYLPEKAAGLKQLLQEQAGAKRRLAAAEDEWLTASEKLHALESPQPT
ncbi:MAG: ATP-binding cassette domain-containing protein [Nevskia sp.]|nr:ATP-binding cassette domain-containing protein [Nevskia sp.]